MSNIRQNFYLGQNVSPENLNNIQDYSNHNHDQLVSSILGYGIVSGFDIKIIDKFLIGISTGLAFNKAGTHLESSAEQQVDCISFAPTVSDKVIKLGVIRKYKEEEFVIDSLGNHVPSKLIPDVQFVLGEQLDQDVLELAQLTLSVLGVSDIQKTAPKLTKLDQLTQQTSSFYNEDIDGQQIASIEADMLYINQVSFQDTVRDLVYPIGVQYHQTVDEDFTFNQEQEPSYLFGGIWKLIHNQNGYFERLEGEISLENRIDGVQDDAMVKLTGTIDARSKNYNSTFSIVSGVFTTETAKGFGSLASPDISNGQAVRFDNSREVRTSTENRPTNILKRIWKRIA